MNQLVALDMDTVEPALSLAKGLRGLVGGSRMRGACGDTFSVATPEIRGAGDDKGDQRRTLTAAAALAAGARCLVIGRPTSAAADPRLGRSVRPMKADR